MPPHISAPQVEALAQTDADAAPSAPTSRASVAPAPEAARYADSSPPLLAKPVLASTLLSNLLRQHHQHHHQRHLPHHITGKGNDYGIGTGYENRVRSGFSELDDYVLMGGVERGAVVGISGEADGGQGGVGRLVSLHLLITVLMSNPLAKASIIDTTGSFPVSLLAKIIRLRTASQLGQNSHGVEKLDIEQALDERVQEILGQVAISRVFDIEGVWEVFSEISADCQSPILARDFPNPDGKKTEDSELMPGQGTAGTGTARTKSSHLEAGAGGEKGLEIGDSEAEEEDEDIDPDDDLVEADISQMDKTNIPASIGNPSPRKANPTPRSKPPESKGRTEVIIIDNMTTPISELFSRRERTFAHTLLTTFSRTLHTLSQTYNTLTLILNTLTSQSPRQGPSRESSRGPSHPSSRVPIPTKPTSVFAATTARPALGRLFSDLTALHLLVTSVPKTAMDAEVLYASPPDPGNKGPRTPPRDPGAGREREAAAGVEYAFVIEVLKDVTGDVDFWLSLPSTSTNHLSISDNLPHSPSHNPASDHLRSDSRSRTNFRKCIHKHPRCQRWAPFTVSPDGLTLQNAFGPGMAGKNVSALGQMHIPKQFPFGRRV